MEISCKMANICKKKFGILQLSGPHNPEVVGSSPASATISSSRNGFRYDYFFNPLSSLVPETEPDLIQSQIRFFFLY